METEKKRKFKWGFTWEIEKLEKWMTDLSGKGMHIDKPGNFWNRYATDPSKKYIYRIDFQQDVTKKGKLTEYTRLYADSGWEYIGSVGPLWHYFRKDALAEEPHVLYTDKFSLTDYYKRIRNVLLLVALINLISLLFNVALIFPNYISTSFWQIVFPISAIQLFLFLVLIFGYLKFNRKVKAAQ